MFISLPLQFTRNFGDLALKGVYDLLQELRYVKITLELNTDFTIYRQLIYRSLEFTSDLGIRDMEVRVEG